MRIAFLFQVPSFWASWESLYDRAIDDGECEVKVYLVQPAKNTSDELVQMRCAAEFLQKKGIQYTEYDFGSVLEFEPNYVIFHTPYDYGHRDIDAWSVRFRLQGIKVVYIPYGIEISNTKESQYKHFSLAVLLNAYAVYTMSEAMREEYVKHCVNYKAVRAIGHPRFDLLRKRYSFSEEMKAKIAGRKVILWKVHFPKLFFENGVRKFATPDLNEYENFINYIQSNKDMFFIFMPHPKFADKTIEEEVREKAQKILDRLSIVENVYIDRDDDYHTSLVCSDAIIVDRSAIMVEAGMLDKPVLYMYNEFFYEPMTAQVEALLDTYEKGCTCEDMKRFVESARIGTDRHKSDRCLIAEMIMPDRNESIADKILADMKADMNKPFDDGRTYKITNVPNVAIWGAGELGRLCLSYCDENKFRIAALVDSDKKKNGKTLSGYGIFLPDDLEKLEIDYIIIATEKYFTEVYQIIVERDLIGRDKIMNYDEFVVRNVY